MRARAATRFEALLDCNHRFNRSRSRSVKLIFIRHFSVISLARYCPAVDFSSPGPFTRPKEPETGRMKLNALPTHHPCKRAICVPGHSEKSVYRLIPYHASNHENEINQPCCCLPIGSKTWWENQAYSESAVFHLCTDVDQQVMIHIYFHLSDIIVIHISFM